MNYKATALHLYVYMGAFIPPHSCHTLSNASSEVVCRTGTLNTISCAPVCPESPPSYKAVLGNRPLYPHLPRLQHKRHKETIFNQIKKIKKI